MFKVTIRNRAAQTLKGITEKHWNQIEERLAGLEINPRPHDSIKLKTSNPCFRIDAGEYRIAYTLNEEEGIVRVVLIGHRKDFYDRLRHILF